jgi:hypothetical protein
MGHFGRGSWHAGESVASGCYTDALEIRISHRMRLQLCGVTSIGTTTTKELTYAKQE